MNGVLNRLLANLDFNPGDDDDDENGMAANQTMTNGFSVRNLLNNLVSGVATALGDQFAQGRNAARQCIRRVVEVSILVTITKLLMMIS